MVDADDVILVVDYWTVAFVDLIKGDNDVGWIRIFVFRMVDQANVRVAQACGGAHCDDPSMCPTSSAS